MKQLIQSFKTGETYLEDIPVPQVSRGKVLIRTTHSLVSLGTERMLVEFGKANLVQKAMQQPDKVKQVLDKIKTDGLMPTLEAVFSRLEQPLPLGYCNVGVVVAVGDAVSDIRPGDRVASNGNHAEYVCVPKNLVARIPDNVSSEEAAFTVIGSIGLQGIRLVNPTFGETVVVTGLGLIGLLTAQMLLANGCRVVGIDIDEAKCKLAESWGVHTLNPLQGADPVKNVLEITQGVGADAVLITASAKSNDIIAQAAQMSRKRGRIVLVGVIGLDISRADFYEKELSFQVSCSYGPGRYDEEYEQRGTDYPLPFVRWTEQRNFEAILNSISSGGIKVKELITERVAIEDFKQVYDGIGSSRAIASLLTYKEQTESTRTASTIVLKSNSFGAQKGVIGVIGAGNFTKMTMLPALKGSGAGYKYIASSTGLSGTDMAKKFGFSHSTTDHKEILKDNEVDTVLITTRHGSHAKFVTEALNAGKHVFVEKPLALDLEQLDQIRDAYEKSGKTLTVGFNRRFSPHMQAIKKSLGGQPGPMNINATMNAGFIPPNVWVHDMQSGGGRIVGEACHYIDLCVFLTGSLVKSVFMSGLGTNPTENTDNAVLILKFQNGSQATVNYFANGSKAYSKERFEVFSSERTWVMDNFRTTKGYGVKGFKDLSTKMDKGHKAQFHGFIQRIQQGGEALIPVNELFNTAKASLASIESLKKGTWIQIDQ